MGKTANIVAYGQYKQSSFPTSVAMFVVSALFIGMMVLCITFGEHHHHSMLHLRERKTLRTDPSYNLRKGGYASPAFEIPNLATHSKNHPVEDDSSLRYVQSYHSHYTFAEQYAPHLPFANQHNSTAFELPSCPDIPPSRDVYPRTYSILDITNNWSPESTDIPAFHFDSLCHFNYQIMSERTKAEAYRKAEMPFILYNMPELNEVVERWKDLSYLEDKLGSTTKHRTETSSDNHFMYWSGGKTSRQYPQWKPSTAVAKYTFRQWLEVAVHGQNRSLNDREHLYFRATGGGADDAWIFKELPFFQPRKQLFMPQPSQQRGIHCRFGMRNVVAEAHFDGSRNAIALIGGLRRYILTHPNQCENMHMFPRGHPSARHSSVDWSQPVNLKEFPNFAKVQANEVVLQPGDFLYLPMYWMHYIVSLNVNFQCNTRSGITHDFDEDLRRCGF
jgi:hypothetical protein